MHCTIKQASTFLGYGSTSTMYRLIHSGMLDDYVERIEDETYLDMAGKGSRAISFDLIPDTYMTQTAVSA